MKRYTLRAIALFAWIALTILVIFSWKSLVDTAELSVPGSGNLAVSVVLFILVLLGWLIQEKFIDLLAPVSHTAKRLSPEERRAAVEKNAKRAIAEGRSLAAIRLYEEAGMLVSALEVARDISDSEGMARLSLLLGHYDRARTFYLNLQDYDGAARASALQDDIESAREYYKEAALACQASAEKEAALWDRAHERDTAARLYDDAGDSARAAECYDLLGDEENAKRCQDQAKALEAYERKQARGTRRFEEQQVEARKKESKTEAQRLLVIGDFFGAAEKFREAEELLDAGLAFERFHEWQRAAKCFEQAGLPDRAEIVRMNIPQDERRPWEKLDGEDAPGAMPSPSSIEVEQFKPLLRGLNVPINVTAEQLLAAQDPERIERLARLVSKGEFKEAAECAAENNDWLMAAALFEYTDNPLRAADVYRQIGKLDDAVNCLEKAGRLKEAGLMALAAGRRDRVLQAYLAALEKAEDPSDLGMMLGELLVEWEHPAEALQVLRKFIAPGGVTEKNAALHYRFARLFEDNQALDEARSVYRQMLKAGAVCDDLANREKHLAQALADTPTSTKPPRTEGSATSPLEAVLNTILGADDEKTALPNDVDELTGTEPEHTFVFSPPADLAGHVAGAAGQTAPGISPEMSLFGSPEVLRAIGGITSFTSTSTIKDAKPRADDPFGISQRYVQKGEIARGGMGVIYQAEDTLLGRDVALKLLLGVSASQEELQQFLLEARAIARLSHPNVVTIFDIGLMERRHYIAMELLNGGSLKDLVSKRKVLPLKEALRIVIDVSKGLRAAHEAGIVHRDIKPGNLLLTDRRDVKIVDFGLAKMHQNTGGAGDETMFRSAGTPGYMAPEQIRGEELKPCCDIYAIGITLFYMLVGSPPHRIAERTTMHEIINFQLNDELPSLSEHCDDIPEAIELLYRYCTATIPAERYPTVDAYLATAEEWYNVL